MDDHDAFARRFFGKGNHLKYDVIANGGLPPAALAEIKPWWDDLGNGIDPVILPRSTGSETVWYGLARSARSFRQLRESLVAFIGPSWTDYFGQPTPMDLSDPVERGIADHFGQWSIRLTVPKHFRAEIRERLRVRRDLLMLAPPRAANVARPVGRIMRDFEEALRLRDAPLIAESLHEIVHTGELEARAVIFLRVLGHDALGDSHSVISEDVDSLVAIRRPRRVSQALVSAIYDLELKPFEVMGELERAIDHFGKKLALRFRNLSGDPTSLRRSSRSWYLLSALYSPAPQRPTAERAAELLQRLDLTDWETRLIGLLESGARPSTPETEGDEPSKSTAHDALSRAQALLNENQILEAFNVAQLAARSADQLELLINTAWALDTLEAVATALNALESADASLREECLARPGVRKTVQIMRTESASDASPPDSIPRNWADFYEALHAPSPRPGLVAVAEHGMDEWSPADLTNPRFLDRLTQSFVRDLPAWGVELRARTLPYFLTTFDRLPSIPPGVGDVLDAVLLLLLTDDAPSSGYFATATTAVEMRIAAGITVSDYRALLEDLQRQLTTYLSAKNLSQALDLIDALLESPAPDKSARVGLFGQVVGIASGFANRVSRSTRMLLAKLSEELDVDLPPQLASLHIEDDDEEPIWQHIKGKTFALYSLNTSATRRVAAMLRDAGARVKEFDNKGGDPALRAAAQNSDVFVMAWAAATHAATGFIEANRGDGLPLLRPRSKGSGSMWNAIIEWAQN